MYGFSYPKSSNDLEEILRNIHGYGFCPGGLEYAKTGHCKSRIATQDAETKRCRHKNCPFVRPNTDDGLCTKCHSLYKTFQTLAVNNSKAIKGITLKNSSPEEVVVDMKKTLTKVNLQLREVQQHLDHCLRQMEEKDYDDVMEQVKKKGLPEVQVPNKIFLHVADVVKKSIFLIAKGLDIQ